MMIYIVHIHVYICMISMHVKCKNHTLKIKLEDFFFSKYA